MRDFEPNYDKYSLSELHEALDAIDRKEYPDRVKKIESILSNPKKLSSLKNKQRKINSKRSKERKQFVFGAFGLYLFIAGIVGATTGVFLGRHGVFEVNVGFASYFFGICTFVLGVRFLIKMFKG